MHNGKAASAQPLHANAIASTKDHGGTCSTYSSTSIMESVLPHMSQGVSIIMMITMIINSNDDLGQLGFLKIAGKGSTYT